MANEAEEVQLNCVQLDSVQRLREVFRDNSDDFWVASVSSQDPEVLQDELTRMEAGPYLAAEAFTHCFVALSEDPTADVETLTAKFGLGQRRKKVPSCGGGPGFVLVFTNEDGFSKLYKENHASQIARMSKEVKQQGSTCSLQTGKKEQAKTRKKALKRKSTEDAGASRGEKVRRSLKEIVNKPRIDMTLADLMKKPRTDAHLPVEAGLRNDPITSNVTGSRGSTLKAPRSRTWARSHKQSLPPVALHKRQVSVIKKRLERLLPQIPKEQLSTSMALTKLEECMQKPKGRFDKFRDEVEKILINFIVSAPAAAGPGTSVVAKPAAPASVVKKAPPAPAPASRRVGVAARVGLALAATGKPPLKAALQALASEAPPSAAAPVKDAETVEVLDEKRTACPNCGTVYMPGSLFCRHCGHKRETVQQDELPEVTPRSSPASSVAGGVQAASVSQEQTEKISLSIEDEEPSEENGDAEQSSSTEPFEVDEFGFQVALSQLRDAAAGRPADSVAVLCMLLKAKPSKELLERGAWEAALAAHQRMAPSKRTARLAKQVQDRWRSLCPQPSAAAGRARRAMRKAAAAKAAAARQGRTSIPRSSTAAAAVNASPLPTRSSQEPLTPEKAQKFYDQAFAAIAQLEALKAGASVRLPPPAQGAGVVVVEE